MLSIKERVSNGFDALTEYHGDESWTRSIDTDLLSVESVIACPLFYVFGGYMYGLEALDLDTENDAIDHGFELDNYGDDSENDALSAEWIRRVKAV